MNIRNSYLYRWSLMTAGATLMLGTALVTSSHSQSIGKPDTPLKVALVLDCITQPRFQDDLRNFGMSRVLPAAGGHLVAGQLSLNSPKDRDLFKSAEESHRDFAIGFFHCAHVPGSLPKAPVSASVSGDPGKRTAAGKRPVLSSEPPGIDDAERLTCVSARLNHPTGKDHAAAGREWLDLFSAVSKIEKKALPKLMKGQGVDQEMGDWLVVARPVRALKASCLKCHEGAKQGDTLGVLTYIVSKKTFAAALPSPVRTRGGLGGL
jgi:hypothetical protein